VISVEQVEGKIRQTLSYCRGSCENALFNSDLKKPDMSESSASLRKWMCVVCGYIYDEAIGVPDEGIPAGTRWEDVPETWTCPDCGTTKDDFEMIELD
jgi:rubredoxin